tara:strand:- start:2452 stop:2634 length:183 start_codon:yes stop_codon:yes gene_type:complete
MSLNKGGKSAETVRPASSSELNSWKRGFTPQAEIWNGRMAIIGLMGFLAILFISNIVLVG